MLKKILSVTLCMAFVLAFGQVNAQKKSGPTSYSNGIGMRVEFGEGGALVGFSAKHFFSLHNAGEAQLLFGSGATYLDLEYQYHAAIPNAAGLQWYAGMGPALAFYKGGTDLYIRPLIGLDYKINNVPLNFGIDWRPTFRATHSESGSQFTAARFGLAFRYAF